MASKMAGMMVICQLAILILLVVNSEAQSSGSFTYKLKATAKNLNGIRLELVKQLQVCGRDKVASEVFQLSGYILSRCISQETLIHGYDARTYRHLGDTRWTIPGETVITDFFANTQTKSLYIRVNSNSASTGTDTWRITLSNHSSTLYNTIVYPHTMYSVSGKDHALVVHQSTRGDRKLSVYGADGREFHRVNLPGKKEYSSIEETESGTFLLGQRYTDDDPYAFKEMNKYGKIIQSYQLYSRQRADKITYPYQMVTDKLGNIFVSDVLAPTLHVMDSNLTMSRQILTSNTSNKGFTNIAYDPDADRLLVVSAAYPRNLADIYQITYDQ